MNILNFKWLVFSVFILLSGCDLVPSWLNVTVNFSDGKGVKVEDPVEFNGAPIGKVSAVNVIPSGVTIALKLEKSKAATVQGNAQAAIIADQAQHKIVLTNPPEPGAPLADGAVLVALEPGTGFGSILGAIDKVQQAVKQATKSAGEYFNDANQGWQDSKKKMDDQLSALQQLTKSSEDEIRSRYQALIQEIESARGEAEGQSKQVLNDYAVLEKELLEKQQTYSDQGKAKAAETLQALRDELKAGIEKFK